MTDLERAARALYERHAYPPDLENGRAGSPPWENASAAVRQWCAEQAAAVLSAVFLDPSDAVVEAAASEMFDEDPAYLDSAGHQRWRWEMADDAPKRIGAGKPAPLSVPRR